MGQQARTGSPALDRPPLSADCFAIACRAMDGSGAWVKQSQPEQALRGRTMRFTMKRPAAPLSRMQACVRGQRAAVCLQTARGGDVFQLFGHIFAQAAQLAAALGTVCVARG